MLDTSKTNARLLDWQRRLDPGNFNKAKGAVYHTAPAIVFPDAADYPDDLSDDAVTMMFQIDGDMWIGTPVRCTIERPLVVEKQVRRGRKNAPVVILSDTRALCVVPVSANYYWSANVLTRYETLRIAFKPEKADARTKTPKHITCIATFLPTND